MISQTTVSVDEATRQVLDELCDSLAQRPPWASQLRGDLSEGVRDALGVALGALRLDDAINKAQSATVLAVKDSQRETTSAVQAVASVAESEAKALRGLASVHSDRIATVLDALQQLKVASELQRGLVAQLRTDQSTVVSACTRIEVSVDQVAPAVSALHAASGRSDQQRDAKLATIEKALHEMGLELRRLGSAQASHGQVLSSLAESITALSRPWWKKLF